MQCRIKTRYIFSSYGFLLFLSVSKAAEKVINSLEIVEFFNKLLKNIAKIVLFSYYFVK